MESEVTVLTPAIAKGYYTTLINNFFEDKELYLEKLGALFDESISQENCKDIIQISFFSDGTYLFELEYEVVLLYNALMKNRKFGCMTIENTIEKSPDPEKPWMTDHVVIKIPTGSNTDGGGDAR